MLLPLQPLKYCLKLFLHKVIFYRIIFFFIKNLILFVCHYFNASKVVNKDQNVSYNRINKMVSKLILNNVTFGIKDDNLTFLNINYSKKKLFFYGR